MDEKTRRSGEASGGEGRECLQEREEGGQPTLGLGDAAGCLALAGGPEPAARAINKPHAPQT